MASKSKFLLNLHLFFSILAAVLVIIGLFAAFHLINFETERETLFNYPLQLWIIIILIIFILVLSFFFAKRLINNISKLKTFAGMATKGVPVEIIEPFSQDELGEISTEIISLYSQLQKTKGDLTRKELEKEQESIRLKRDLTNNISHELKTPVTSIHGYLETIINTPDMPKEQMLAFVNKSYAQTKRLSLLLKDISTLTRMDEASYMIEKELIDLSEIINECIQDLAIVTKEKNISIVSLIEKPLPINGNTYLIHSIFSNLIDNALAYSGCSQITVDLIGQNREDYILSFADNGIGVEDFHLNRIFERFYRIDKGRSRKLGGTGLGLAIVKNAVKIHGGRIDARRADGGGLEFIIRLKKSL